jgi:hypothetical protein
MFMTSFRVRSDGLVNWRERSRLFLDQAIKVVPDVVSPPALRKVDSEFTVVELCAVAEVGAGDQQLVIGNAALHMKNGGSLAL